MEEVLEISNGAIFCGDTLQVLKTIDDNYFDSVVTDPPYGISFMNKKWDYDVPSVEVWKEVLRVLKPGGHILCACGTRTQHRMVVNIEDAGFEIRDVITWHYGSGFPKSMDISKAIDKAAGAEREVVGISNRHGGGNKVFEGQGGTGFITNGKPDITAPSTEEAKQWEGWGTALKPATEFWTLARKPLAEKTVAANVLKHGTGGINIDDSRIEGVGRFPANVIFDEFTGSLLDEQSGTLKSGIMKSGVAKHSHWGEREFNNNETYGDSGGASRFFYCAKASQSERNKGTENGNNHPTVKPVALMRYLVKLITPIGGIVLDPYNGSGTTGVACKSDGFGYVGIERDLDSCIISKQRIESTT